MIKSITVILQSLAIPVSLEILNEAGVYIYRFKWRIKWHCGCRYATLRNMSGQAIPRFHEANHSIVLGSATNRRLFSMPVPPPRRLIITPLIVQNGSVVHNRSSTTPTPTCSNLQTHLSLSCGRRVQTLLDGELKEHREQKVHINHHLQLEGVSEFNTVRMPVFEMATQESNDAREEIPDTRHESQPNLIRRTERRMPAEIEQPVRGAGPAPPPSSKTSLVHAEIKTAKLQTPLQSTENRIEPLKRAGDQAVITKQGTYGNLEIVQGEPKKTEAKLTASKGKNDFKNASRTTVSTPDEVFSTKITRQKQLPSDPHSGRQLITIDESLLPTDEQYPGPISWSELIKWNDTCEKLDIIERKQRGEDPQYDLCRRCKRLRLVWGDKFSWDPTIRLKPFGTWLQLLLRPRCRICRLVVLSLSCGTFSLHPMLAAVDKRVQFTQLIPEVLESGEIALSVEYAMRKFGIIRMITPENWFQVLRQAYEVGSHPPLQQLLDDTSVFHNKSGQVASLRLLKEWIKDCETRHGLRCSTTWKRRHTQGHSSIVLIDVQDRCLTSKSILDTRYFALSYVWGGYATPQTIKANFVQRQKKMGLEHGMPRTIEDAILLVERLGERYLWVDALCIVQDDSSNKHSAIAMMDTIYDHAVATIIALAGTNANAGLPGVRPGTRPPQRIEVPQLAMRQCGPTQATIELLDKLAKDDPEEHKLHLHPANHAVDCLEYSHLESCYTKLQNDPFSSLPKPDAKSTTQSTVVWPFMAAHPPSLKHILEISPWNTRGWTLQERLLSRRCIYFASEYYYFQCVSMIGVETGGHLLTWSDISATGDELFPLRGFEESNPLYNLRYESMSRPQTQRGKITKKDLFDLYSEVVTMYSERHLSFSSDALNAVNGVLNVFDQFSNLRMVAGLPSQYLDLALLWAPTGPHDRITPVGKMDNLFPSWSWTSWTGRKQYLLAERERNGYGFENRKFATSEVGEFVYSEPGRKVTIYSVSSPKDLIGTEIVGDGPESNNIESSGYSGYFVDIKKSGLTLTSRGSILEFWAYSVKGESFRISEPAATLSDPEHGNIPGKGSLQRLIDTQSKHCGVTFEFQRSSGKPDDCINQMEYLLISSFPDTKNRQNGIPTMKPISFFDESVFPCKGTGSGLVNLLLVKRFDTFVERVSVAQVHRQAWEATRPVRKHIRLA